MVSGLILLLTAVSCGSSDQKGDHIVSDTGVNNHSVSSQKPMEISLSDLSLIIGKGITRRIDAVGGNEIKWDTSDENIASVDEDGNVQGVNLGECVITAKNEFGNSAQCSVTVKKTCYLTFDDGPTANINYLLDTLKSHDVHATFFLVNTYYLPSVQRMVDEGHTLALHTNKNSTKHCYRSMYSYYDDLDILNDRLEELVGIRSDIIRFPGGTTNSVCDPLRMRQIVNGADDLGYRIFDWTISSGDAIGGATASIVTKNVFNECFHDVEIILMHDKNYTADALNRIIPALRDMGYVFETLDHYPGHSYQHKCRYSWNHPDVPAVSVSLDQESVELQAEDKLELVATAAPYGCTDYICWESSDSSIATVSKAGLVKGIAPGEVIVTARTTSGQTAQCKVKVLPAVEE